MTKHLIPCECGQQLPVSLGQAGETVACPCGRSVEVPTLRRLREMPVAGDAEAAGAGWGFSQGVLALGLIVAALLLGGAGWLRAAEPSPPTPPDAEKQRAAVAEGIGRLSPADAWALWEGGYKPLAQRGFNDASSGQQRAVAAAIDRSRAVQRGLAIAAGAVVALTLAVFAFLPR